MRPRHGKQNSKIQSAQDESQASLSSDMMYFRPVNSQSSNRLSLHILVLNGKLRPTEMCPEPLLSFPSTLFFMNTKQTKKEHGSRRYKNIRNIKEHRDQMEVESHVADSTTSFRTALLLLLLTLNVGIPVSRFNNVCDSSTA